MVRELDHLAAGLASFHVRTRTSLCQLGECDDCRRNAVKRYPHPPIGELDLTVGNRMWRSELPDTMRRVQEEACGSSTSLTLFARLIMFVTRPRMLFTHSFFLYKQRL